MPTELKEINELYDNFADKYDNEVKKIHTAYKWLGSLLTIIIVAGGFFFYSTTRDIKSEYQDVISRMESNLNKEIEFSKQEMQQKVNATFEEIRLEISNRINKEFDSEKINSLVEKKSTERIDKVADQLIVDAIQSRINPQIKSSEDKLTLLLDNADDKIGILEYNLYKTMALNDSRFAYDQIYIWSKQDDYQFNIEAKEAVEEIIKEYKDPKYYRTGGDYMVTKAKYDKLSIEQIRNEFSSASREEKINLINVLLHNIDIKKNQKGKFLLIIIKNDPSLQVVSTASKKLIKLYNLDFGYLDLSDIISWGEKNI